MAKATNGTNPPRPIESCYLALGAKIVMMRYALGLRQEDLAKKIGLTRASIANIETGRQRVLRADVERIASAFGTTPKHLLRGIWF